MNPDKGLAGPKVPPADGAKERSRRERLSVCIVTFERPQFLKRCLSGLMALGDAIDEIVVVDSSRIDGRDSALAAAPGIRYIHAPHLAGWMTRARNEGLRWVAGDLIAFIDDDVVVHPGWAEGLRAAFHEPTVAAVSGRTINGHPGEESYDRPIGRLLPDGRLTDGFASDPGRIVDVDHGIGANMTFRRSVLAELGGFRDDYPGTALREDTDIYLRVKAAGGRAVFTPEAAVDHRPAPHSKGARFDTRYKLYARRNHTVLLARNCGIGSRELRRWVRGELAASAAADGGLARMLRMGITVTGLAWGVAALPRAARWVPLPPRRQDPKGLAVRASLSAWD